MAEWKSEKERIGLPLRSFMYTSDQIAGLLELKEDYVKKKLFFYDVREPGLCPKSKMRAVNIAPDGETPVWRVTEREFLRYLRNRGIKFYEMGYII